MSKRMWFPAATTLMLMILPLHANVLLPGDTNILPDVFPNPGDVAPLAQTTGTFGFGSGIGLLTGTYFEAVVVDPLGVTCSGCLDFAFQVSEDPGLSSGIFNMSLANFRGYTTDAGYIAGSGSMGGNGGNGDPISVNRGPLGGTVGFVFSSTSSPDTAIGPGGSSDILVVATNATTYDSLGVLGINGGRAGSPANGQITGLFEPTLQNPVPEPSAALLLSLGLLGIAAALRCCKSTSVTSN